MDQFQPTDIQPLMFKVAQRLREYATLLADSNHEHITVAQERVLAVLFSHFPHGAKVKDIAKELSLSPATTSQTIDSLVKEGLLDRVQSQEDRRAVIIQPTEKCARIKQVNSKRFAVLFAEALSKNSQDEIDCMGNMLLSLLETTKKYNDNEKKKQSQVMVIAEEHA